MKRPRTRRDFLAKVAALSAVAPALSRVLGANDRIQMGVIGAGKRGYALMNRMRTQKKCTVVVTAVCDVLPEHQERARQATGNAAEKYADHRGLLEQKDIDAVLIASPEHWHRDHLVDAVKAGKDAYVEKPLGRTVDEALHMVQAVRESKRIVQVGTQERSSSHFLSAKNEIIDKGLLGSITHISSWWRLRWSPPPNGGELKDVTVWKRFLGPAPDRPLTSRRFWDWQYYWDYSGGLLSDKGHHVCDWTHWFTGAVRPSAAMMAGGTYAVSGWEVPDTFTAVWEYPENWIAEFSVSYSSSFADWHDHGTCFRGTDGALEISRRGWRYYAERNKCVLKESGGSDMDGEHIDNFLACLCSRKEPNAPVESGLNAVCATYGANTAFLRKQRITLLADGRLAPIPPAVSGSGP